jgi:hypothetical protein
VLQVCNHPELFERRDAKSPIHVTPCVFRIPYLIYDANVRAELFLKLQKYFLFTPKYITDAVRNNFNDTIFSICLALNISFHEMHMILRGDVKTRYGVLNVKFYFSTVVISDGLIITTRKMLTKSCIVENFGMKVLLHLQFA